MNGALRILQNDISICALVLIGLMFSGCSKNSQMSAEELYLRGLQYLQEDNLEKACVFFTAAAEKENLPIYNWAVARSASTRNTALLFAWKAWNGGLKTGDVLNFLIYASGRQTDEEKIAYGLKLLSEMPDSVDKDLFRGEIYLNNGKPDSAMVIWSDALRNRPGGHLVNALGRIYLIKDQYDSLMILLHQADSLKCLDQQAYSLFAFSLSHSARFSEALQLLARAPSRHFDNGQLSLDRIWIDMLSGNYSDAKQSLQSTKPYCRDESLRYKLVLLEAFISRQTLDTGHLEMMKESLCSLSVQKSECMFVQAMLLCLKGDSSGLVNLEKMQKADPLNPALVFAMLNEFISFGKKHDAIGLFSSLPLSISRFPSVVLLQAQLEASNGKLNTALELLNSMHRRGAHSKASLEFQQNVTFRLHMDQECFFLQEMLEKTFPDDVDIRFKRVLLFLRAGNGDSALAILDKIPQEGSFSRLIILARLHAYFIKKEYEKITTELGKKTDTVPEMLVFRAQAELMQKDTSSALETFKLAVKNTQNPFVYLEYAELLAKLKRYDEASICYSKAISDIEKQFPVHHGFATILSKAAWCQLKTGKSLRQALQYSKKAYQINQKDIDIIYIHCLVLAQTGQQSEAITLLKRQMEHNRNPVLLFCLGKIYKSKGKITQVKKIYAEFSAMRDSTLHVYKLSRDIIESLVR
ncbi:MAG: hypothetical protein GX556_04875 [Fibrobacter sp.]|nr:hypothetical protein [Fibrobacter sp.]